MRASPFQLAEHIHKVLINFPKRTPPTGAHTPHAHPSAPPEIKSSFQDFLKKIETSSELQTNPRSSSTEQTASLAHAQYTEFWDAPPRFWHSVPIEEAEIDAVQSGGASLR